MDITGIINSLSTIRNVHENELRELKSTIKSLNEENDDLRDDIYALEGSVNTLEEKISDRGVYADQYKVIEKLYYDKLSLSSEMFEYELDHFFRKILNKRLK